ncbi:TPA: ABC transporter ATP-binding protein [Streptococcus agalactiae]|uniref:ABC transporter ATP-binding protein n=1 Tax=Bacillota TaxID=1239 RepID=UPI000306ED1A|nr:MULTISPECIES: ATP-binding cassette domain-containing protein [Bacillota]HEO1201140.1 ATP-binding cassette domain-containing protein [Streptococcus agalactiae]HEP4080960.1 ATP-binding cassette domain-containing protein [Streptococcus pyogenes]EPV96448.1 bacitracin ABC transporter ATP-binding protein [Streptococcus agalactiae FSL S3-014]MBG0489528.1 ATP-binding cassette domain-containing protein [Enterococcus faecium]MBS5775983.1 ATP-binding cassette domain-containing protein [Finegoldia magn
MNSILSIKDLEKYYEDSPVLKSINININEGEIYGLLGRNGAGKTTIMKIILGLTKPTKGKVILLGSDTSTDKGKEVLKNVGCIIESPGFYSNLTATENLMIFAKLRGDSENSVKEALKLVNLPYNDKKLFGKYSLGMKQRLAIANAIMHKPKVLILDEPINGLDPIGIAEVRDLIKSLKENGTTILISSHILPELENLADRIGIINDGNLIDEINLEEWNSHNEFGVKIYVDKTQEAINLLSKNGVNSEQMATFNKGIIIKNENVKVSDLNKIFIKNDFEVNGIIEEKITLEDYFKKVTGGQGIG